MLFPLRLLGLATDLYPSPRGLFDVADQFYDAILVKRMFGAWKAAQDRIRVGHRFILSRDMLF